MPMLPEQIWRRRLDSEYAEMQSSGERFEVNAERTRYLVSVRGIGLYRNGDSVMRRDAHSVQINLLREYPYPGGIDLTWLTPIFHPNIHEKDGKVCIQLINNWAEGQTILSVVKALKQLLEHPNTKDPLNRDAAVYFDSHPDALAGGALPVKSGPRIVSPR